MRMGINCALKCGRSGSWSPAQLSSLAAWYEAGPEYCYTDGAVQLNGLGYVNYLSRGDGSALRTGDIDFWVAGWMKTGNYSVPQVSVLQKYREFVLEWRGAHNCFYFKTTKTTWEDTFVTSSTGVLPNDTWGFVIAWHDAVSNTINIVVNNSQAITASTGGSLADYYNGGDDIYIGIAGEENTNTCFDSVCFGKSPPGGIAGIISTISSRLYNSGDGLTYADLTTQEKTDWGLVSFWNLNESSGTRNDSHGTNHLTDNNSVGLAAGIAQAQCGDGDPIALWTDRSGNAYNLTQTDPLKRPTLRLVSGKWCVRFDGVNDWMSVPGIAISQPASFYLKHKLNNTSPAVIFQSVTYPPRLQYFIDASGIPTTFKYQMFAGASLLENVAAYPLPETDFRKHLAVFNGAVSELIVDDTTQTGDCSSEGAEGLYVGVSQGTAVFANGDFKILAIQSVVSSAASRVKMFQYMDLL